MISIVTINYKHASDTLALLGSLEGEQSEQWDMQLVDNASGDDDRSRLGAYVAASALPIHLILSDDNLGFSGGNNVGIRKALASGAEWIVLLNNDCTVPAGWARELHEQLQQTEPGLYALPIQEGDRTTWCGRVTWLATTLQHVYDRDDAVRILATGAGYAVGAACVIHRSVLKDVGPWDERYFLYFEDADYSLRARRNGHPVGLLDTSAIAHGVSVSTRALGSPLLLRYHARNSLLFNSQHAPLWARISLPFVAFSRILTQAVKLVFLPSRRSKSRGIALGISDFYAKRFGHIPENSRA